MVTPITITKMPKTIDGGFYTLADVSRLAGASRSRLYYWKQKGVIAPNVESEDFDGAITRGYSCAYLVYVGLLRRLLDSGYSLERSVRGLRHLRERFGPPSSAWFDVRLAFDGTGLITYKDDEWGATVATWSGQRIAPLVLAVDFTVIGHRLDALLLEEEFQPFVEMDPSKRSGLPVVRGTTIRTSLIYDFYRSGESVDEIHASYPALSVDKIAIAIEYERSLDAIR